LHDRGKFGIEIWGLKGEFGTEIWGMKGKFGIGTWGMKGKFKYSINDGTTNIKPCTSNYLLFL
jgi:hypothetical protein